MEVVVGIGKRAVWSARKALGVPVDLHIGEWAFNTTLPGGNVLHCEAVDPLTRANGKCWRRPVVAQLDWCNSYHNCRHLSFGDFGARCKALRRLDVVVHFPHFRVGVLLCAECHGVRGLISRVGFV